MPCNDLNRRDTADPSLSERLQRNQREIFVAVALTLAALVVLVGHYAL